MQSLFSPEVINQIAAMPVYVPPPKPKLILRGYQEEAIESAINHFKNYDAPAILCLPTGAGKSIVIAEIIKRLGNEHILILQPNKEILEQNYNKLIQCDISRSEVGMYAGSVGEKNRSRVTYAIINSIYNQVEDWMHFKYIIIDECHLCNAKNEDGMYAKFINTLKAKTIGLTATPYRLHSSFQYGATIKMLHRTRPLIFKRVIFNVNNQVLFENGYLSPLEYVKFEQQMKLKLASADFEEKSVNRHYMPKMREICNKIAELSSKRKAILVFTTSIEMCFELKERLQKYYDVNNPNGLKVNTVSSKDNIKTRTQAIRDFINGNTQIMINVGILTTGFDFPDLDCIVMLRPTISLSLYYQMLGRGIRLSKNKENCLVVDYANNLQRFGKIEDLHLGKCPKGLDNVYGKLYGHKAQLSHIPFVM